jgi:quercetin dioxygenase-like cupin family protein
MPLPQPNTEQYLNTLMTWHMLSADSGGAFSLGEVLLQPGDEPPLHIHAREDETWYILEGTILFQRGVERVVRHAGQAILLPRGVQHGFAVQSPKARILHFYTPAGIEEAFRSLSVAIGKPASMVRPEELTASFQKRGVAFVGPPLPALLAQEYPTEVQQTAQRALL